MLKVLIDEEQANPLNLERRKGTKNGRDWAMVSQIIWVYKPNSKFPVEIQFVLQDGQSAYPEGEYTLDLDHGFAQGSFQSIHLDTRKLALHPVTTSNVPKSMDMNKKG